MESIHYSEVWAVEGGGGEDEWRKGLMGGAVGLAPIPKSVLIGCCRGNCMSDLIYPPSRALFPVRALPCSAPFTRFDVRVESPPPNHQSALKCGHLYAEKIETGGTLSDCFSDGTYRHGFFFLFSPNCCNIKEVSFLSICGVGGNFIPRRADSKIRPDHTMRLVPMHD